MSERLTGQQQFNEVANAHAIAGAEAAAQREVDAIAAEAAAQAATAASEAEQTRLADIEARRYSPEVQQMNQEADVAIFGSRGATEGYANADGSPLDKPLIGKVDDFRENRKYGTKEADRNEKADAYIEDIDSLQTEGFELTQAKLVMDLREERIAKAEATYEAIYKSLPKEMDHSKKDSIASRRMIKMQKLQGDNDGMIKHVIKNEGLFNRDEYDKFRFKMGKDNFGETRQFTAYKTEFVQRDKLKQSQASSAARKHEHKERENLKATRREQKEDYKFPNQKQVHYQPRVDKNIQLGLSMDTPGSVLDFSKHEATNDVDNRKILISYEDGKQIYIRGKELYRVGADEDGKQAIVSGEAYIKSPRVLVGTGGIELVEVATSFADKDTKGADYKAAGYDPYEALDKLIDASKKPKPPVVSNGDPRPRVSADTTPNKRRGMGELLKSRRAKLGAALATLALLGGATVAVGELSDDTSKPAANSAPASANGFTGQVAKEAARPFARIETAIKKQQVAQEKAAAEKLKKKTAPNGK